MSKIQGYLQNIMQAVYGKDVRQSIHDAIETIDSVADTAKDSATASAKMAETMAENAGKYADEAQTCVVAAAASEANAKASETAVKASENAAKTSADNAVASETAVAESKDAAAASEANAKTSEEAAGRSAEVATEKAAAADQSADTAAEKAEIATEKAAEIVGKAEAVAASATKAQSYAVGGTGSRDGEDADNAAYYYRQAKSISESFAGALRPMGTVAFASLPALTSVTAGDMYNISDEFTTTDDFKEGSGNVIPAGANIYKTSDGKWDVLAGTPVTGVKGEKEASYRRGNVNITPANIGLGNVDNTADADKTVKEATKLCVYNLGGFSKKTITDLKSSLDAWVSNNKYKGSMCCFIGSADWITYWNNNNTTDVIGAGAYWTVQVIAVYGDDSCIKLSISSYGKSEYRAYKVNGTWSAIYKPVMDSDDISNTTVTFASGDTADSGANTWTSVATMASGEKHASLFAKVSQMFKNVRYLYKMLGTTDISGIGGGTVTGAIVSQNIILATKGGSIGYASDCSLESAVNQFISDMAQYVPYLIHADNVGGTPVTGTPNDVTIEVIVLNKLTNAYRIVLYNNKGTDIHTICRIDGAWKSWVQIA